MILLFELTGDLESKKALRLFILMKQLGCSDLPIDEVEMGKLMALEGRNMMQKFGRLSKGGRIKKDKARKLISSKYLELMQPRRLRFEKSPSPMFFPCGKIPSMNKVLVILLVTMGPSFNLVQLQR